MTLQYFGSDYWEFGLKLVRIIEVPLDLFEHLAVYIKENPKVK
jgi:hypothetical protein